MTKATGSWTKVVNLHNAAAPMGDFSGDLPMPFSPKGLPVGSGELLALRLTGCLNIKTSTTMTVAVGSDDGMRLTIGGALVVQHTSPRTFRRDTRVVEFQDPGQYAVELVYFQNFKHASLELATAPGLQPELIDSKLPLSSVFILLPAAMIHSTCSGGAPRSIDAGPDVAVAAIDSGWTPDMATPPSAEGLHSDQDTPDSGVDLLDAGPSCAASDLLPTPVGQPATQKTRSTDAGPWLQGGGLECSIFGPTGRTTAPPLLLTLIVLALISRVGRRS